MTYIDIKDCENDLKTYYNIPANDRLILYVIDYKNEKLDKEHKYKYHIFSQNGTLLDKSICSSKGIIIDTPITPAIQDKIKEAEVFKSHGIDVYNPKDSFFNDLCVLFPLNKYTDIPRKDRITKYLQTNESFCPEECELLSKSNDSTKAKCKCPKPSKRNGELSFDGLKDNMVASLLDANFEVIFCYNLVFELSIFIHNYGCWTMCIIGLGIVINLGFFCVKFVNPLKNDLNTFRESLPSLHSNRPNNHINVQNNVRIDSSVNRHLPIAQHNKHTNGDIRDIDLDDYQNMTYDEIIGNDHRSFCTLYWNYIQLVHPIINSFFVKSKRILKTVKIAKFLIGFMLDLSLSAFFYSDKYISNNYNKNDSFLYDLPVSLYSYLLSSVINALLFLLSNSEKAVSKILKLENPDTVLDESKKFIKTYKIKLIIFCVLYFALCLFFVYYVSAFCSVYQNSQIELLRSCGISLGISMSLPIVLCLIFASLRLVIIKMKSKCLNGLLSFIMWFF